VVDRAAHHRVRHRLGGQGEDEVGFHGGAAFMEGRPPGRPLLQHYQVLRNLVRTLFKC
jgi:hypothetical protein